MLITEMTPGTPCWFELQSSDFDRSSAFFLALFGWERHDMDMGPMGIYSFLAKSNGTIGAMCSLPPDQKDKGVPSNWAVYFTATNCDAETEKAKQLGAHIIMPPFDVGEYGRMSVLADPSGAVFCLWQSKATTGGKFLMFEDYAVGWVELAARDTQASKKFYGDLFGWSFKDTPTAVANSGNYIEFAKNGTNYGGILPMSPEWGNIPPHWAIYFMVPDVDACVAKTKELGGDVCLPPFDAPGVGRIAMITEPAGANCYVITLKQ